MKEESILLLSDLQKLINQVVLIDYTIIILGGIIMKCVNEKSIEQLNVTEDLVGKQSTALCILACGSVCSLAWEVGGIYVASMTYAIGL